MKGRSFLLSLLLITVGLCPSAEAQDGVVLAGRAIDVKLREETPQSIEFEIDLDLSLRNTSSTPAIFYRDEFTVEGEELFTYTKDGQVELLYRRFTPSSIDLSPVWKNLRQRLNTPTPPSDLTLALAGGELLVLRRKVVVHFDKSKALATWQEISTRSPLFLRITLEGFPNNVESHVKPGNSFGKSLQAKWRRFGQLILEPVRSELIPIKFTGIAND